MSKYSRFVVLSSILLFMLLFGLACPVTVSADDGNPTPPATEEPVQPPAATEEPAATEPAVIVTEEPVVVETTPSPTAEPTEESGAESPAEKKATVADVLEAAPEDTEIVVLGESGESLPLTSVEASETVAMADPVWCPAGQNPGNDMKDGTQNCTDKFSTPQELIDAMGSDVDGIYEEDGVIYFTANPGGAFILIPGSGALDTAEYDTLKTYNLTLQGGWNGATGSTFALSGQTNFGANPVQIGDDTNPWAGNLTIKNITIEGASTTGLAVFTEGDINLNNVNSNSNDGNGIEAYSNSDITLTGVMADGNAGDGVYLDNSSGSGNIKVGSSTSGGVSASGNGVNGIEAASNGNITLEHVTANGNAETGASLMNFLGGGRVTVTSSTFGVDDGVSGNGATGLFVATNGNVTLTGVTANGNNLDGVSIINSFGGKIMIVDSNFDGNAKEEGAGLAILTTGSVVLNGVSASNNEDIGAFILAYDVTIQDSIFEENGYDGLSVNSGDLTIVCSQFWNNGNVVDGGVGVDATAVSGTFTLNDVTFNGNGEGDYIYGGTPVVKSGGCAIVKGSKHGKIHAGSSLPLHIVPVGGGEKVDLDCRSYSGTKLILPSGDNVILYCPVLDDAYLTSLTLQGLSTVPGGFSFVSGMEVKVTRGEEVRTSVGPNVIVSFVVPEDKVGSNFIILHWDGSAWNELEGSYADGYFSVETSLVGVFVLAIK